MAEAPLAGMMTSVHADVTEAQLTSLKKKIAREVKEGEISGLAVAVFKRDGFLWAAQFGKCSAVPKSPLVCENSKFMIASLSKFYIGVAAAWMYEKGHLDLQAPINTLLPYAVKHPDFPDVAITVMHLLTHTSSITDEHYNDLTDARPEMYTKNDASQPNSGVHMTMDKFYQSLLSPGEEFYNKATFGEEAPGKSHDYSNVGSSLAAHICELVARSKGVIAPNGTFDDLVHVAILGPLCVPQDNAAYLASSFSSPAAMEMPAMAIPSDFEKRAYARPVGVYTFPDYPNGGMLTTVQDFAKMAGAVMNDGSFNGMRILKPEIAAFMKEVKFPIDEEESQALILFHREHLKRKCMGHEGGEEGIATETHFNPETGVGFVIFANEGWGDDSDSDDDSDDDESGSDDDDESDDDGDDDDEGLRPFFDAIGKELFKTFEPADYVAAKSGKKKGKRVGKDHKQHGKEKGKMDKGSGEGKKNKEKVQSEGKKDKKKNKGKGKGGGY